MRHRNGFTLIEMLIVVSLLAVILPMAGGTVFFLLRAQSQSADGLRESMALSQFSHTFRSDAHTARTARIVGSGTPQDRMLFALDNARTVEYKAEPSDRVRRTVRRGDVVERRDQFRVGASRASFELADEGSEAAVTIAPRLPGAISLEKGSNPSGGIRIAAIIGRDLRLAARPSKKSEKP